MWNNESAKFTIVGMIAYFTFVGTFLYLLA